MLAQRIAAVTLFYATSHRAVNPASTPRSVRHGRTPRSIRPPGRVARTIAQFHRQGVGNMLEHKTCVHHVKRAHSSA